MIDVYRNDEEQLDVLKAWWRDNRAVLLTALLVSLVASFGWRYWKYREVNHRRKAAATYMALQSAYAKHDRGQVNVLSQKLKGYYEDTIYADFAGLQQASKALAHHDWPAAEKSLASVVDHGHDAGIRQLAKFRLSRVYLADKKPQKVLTVLDDKTSSSFYEGALLKGRAYAMLHDDAKAQAAFQAAQKDLLSKQLMYAELAVLPRGQTLLPTLQAQLNHAMMLTQAHANTKKGS